MVPSPTVCNGLYDVSSNDYSDMTGLIGRGGLMSSTKTTSATIWTQFASLVFCDVNC